ncbi:hypothetical protein HCN44_001970 [Aphidius gifuensis]|uniref:Uncharacterized protein n=1 Tax=Aphidius gifuensis TaxID=684658 RepID=A0A834Y259_APHGI|nr:hypothetical protein HCN44_001970 [Aphidius gifuensis]
MSGILRNTLHLVGTAKYATNNSTKYIRSMTLMASHFHHSAPNYFNRRESDTRVELTSINFWRNVWAAGKILLPTFKDYDRIGTLSISNNYEISLKTNNGLRIITPKKKKNLILSPRFSTKINGKSVEYDIHKFSYSDKKKLFRLGKWNVTLGEDEVTFKLKDSDKTFILKHAVYFKAFIRPAKEQEDGWTLVSPKFDSQIMASSAKITSSTKQAGSLSREFPPPSIEEIDDEITNRPNSFGQVKLRFPMNVVLEGAHQEILLKDTNDTFIIYHEVWIRALTESSENFQIISPNKKKDKTSDIGILRMTLDSGDIKIANKPTKQMIIIRQEVDVAIDLDSEIPSISVRPHIKNVVSV